MGAKSLQSASPIWATRLCGRSMQDIARKPVVKIDNIFEPVYLLHYVLFSKMLYGRSMQNIARTPLVKIYNTFVHVYLSHYYFLERYVGNKNTTETITILRIIRFWVCISDCQLLSSLRSPQPGQGFLLAKSAGLRCSLKYPTQNENHF